MTTMTKAAPPSKFRKALVLVLFMMLVFPFWFNAVTNNLSRRPQGAKMRPVEVSHESSSRPQFQPHEIATSMPLPEPTPEQIKEKQEICEKDVDNSNVAINLIKVDKEQAQYPRILCFVLTISTHHNTKVQAVRETWGQRCDKLIIASNLTDDAIGAVRIDAPADYQHLWLKTKATVKYVYENYYNDYDWFFKADDDTYVILENLRKLIRSPDIVRRTSSTPIQLGHRFSMTPERYKNSVPTKEGELFKIKYGNWVFNSGGSGYAMNKVFVKEFVESFNEKTCLSGMEVQPEDSALAFCMTWKNAIFWNTRDEKARQKFHPFHPSLTYHLGQDKDGWYEQYHRSIGGVQFKQDSISPDSVAFHYMNPSMMRHMERQLYYCRAEKIYDLAVYNQVNNLNISSKILQLPTP